MGIPQTSSGNLNADRRLGFAEAILADGDAAGAAALLRETLDDVPGWVAGWLRCGEMAVQAGDVDLATTCFQRAIELDPADHFGAGLHLDLLRPVSLSDRAPAAHVAALFDQYAPKFEAQLVGKLGYRAPEVIAEALTGTYERALDLGCGTGLMGAAIRSRCTWLAGYDISVGMLSEAVRKGVYDHLEQRDLATLALGEGSYDLIVAADVFIYVGALERIIGWCAGSLTPGGTLAFTVEVGPGPGYTLQPSRRYSHGRDYVLGLLARAGLADVEAVEVVLRQDRGQPVPGMIFLARATGSRQDRAGEATESIG